MTQRHCYLNFASFAFFAVKYHFNYIFLQPPAATTTLPGTCLADILTHSPGVKSSILSPPKPMLLETTKLAFAVAVYLEPEIIVVDVVLVVEDAAC